MSGSDAFRLLLGVVAALAFAYAGSQLLNAADAMDIHSVSGDTINEAFFQAFGVFAKGVGIFLFGLSAFALGSSLPRTTQSVAAPQISAPAAAPEA